MSAVTNTVAEPLPAGIAHDLRECWELLGALHLLRAHLWVGVAGQPTAGLSVIVAVDHERGRFLIDALRDVDALGPRGPVYFDTQVEGRRLRFACHLEQVVLVDNSPAYQLCDPQLVLDQQRRHSYRVRLPVSLRLPVALEEPGKRVSARLLDLSTRGCSTRVEPSIDLGPGDHIKINMRLAPMDFSCAAVVRNVQCLGGASRIGLEFDLEPGVDGQAMEHAVARLQRDILRRRLG